MIDCVRFAPMIGARQGELTAEEHEGLAAHLRSCHACQARLADERSLEGLVGEALMQEAAHPDFSAFADGVMARVEKQSVRLGRRARRAGPESRDARGERKAAPWWRRRWALVLGSTLAPALAALGLVVYLDALGRVPQAGDVEVTSEDHVPMVLQTRDGPVVLLADAEPEET